MTLHWKDKDINFESNEDLNNEDLIKIAIKEIHINPSRIRLYYNGKNGRILLHPRETIQQVGTNEFYVCDTGPQLPFRFAQLLEYVPCIFIWLIVYIILKPESNSYVKILSCMWIFHYCRRAFEVCFVHIFSNATIPIFSILDNSSFKNCLYYWTFAGLQSYFGLRSHSYNEQLNLFGIIIYILGEIGNCYSHIKLRLLRPKGSLLHYKPTGFLFDFITCPNYTCEILSWIGFAMCSQTIISILFPICGGSQMILWAHEKREKLAYSFPEVRERGRILPCKYL